MKFLHPGILILFTGLLIPSCTLEKRHYRNGFYVDFHHSRSHQVVVAETDSTRSDKKEVILPAETLREQEGESFVDAPPSVLHEQVKVRTTIDSVPEQVAFKEEHVPPRDEPAPDMDRPNRKLLWMTVAAIVLVLFGVLAFLPVAALLQIVCFILPVIGVLLFIAFLRKRHNILLRQFAGEKSDDVLLSKFYPNFALPLYLFFGATVAALIGYLLIGTAIGIVGLILFEGGAVIMGAAFLILLVLSVIWLLVWRKRGEGRKKPWEPRPKDP